MGTCELKNTDLQGIFFESTICTHNIYVCVCVCVYSHIYISIFNKTFLTSTKQQVFMS